MEKQRRKKPKSVLLYLSEAELALIDRAVANSDVNSRSALIRSGALKEAQQTLEDRGEWLKNTESETEPRELLWGEEKASAQRPRRRSARGSGSARKPRATSTSTRKKSKA